MNRKTWGITGVVSGALGIAFSIWFLYAISDAILDEDINACYNGDKTPEELGFSGLTCEDIEEKQNAEMLGEIIPFCLCSVTLIFGIVAVIIAAFKKDNYPPVVLAVQPNQQHNLQAQFEMDAARAMMQDAQMAKLQSDAAAEHARIAAEKARKAKEELVQAAQNIAPQPAQNITYNTQNFVTHNIQDSAISGDISTEIGEDDKY